MTNQDPARQIVYRTHELGALAARQHDEPAPSLPEMIRANQNWMLELETQGASSELDWLAPLIDGRNVLEVGSSLGINSIKLASMCRSLACYDPCPDRSRATVASLQLNAAENARTIQTITELDLHKATAMVVNLKRMTPEIVRSLIALKAPDILIFFGPMSADVVRMAMDAGHTHRPAFHKAGVFLNLNA